MAPVDWRRQALVRPRGRWSRADSIFLVSVCVLIGEAIQIGFFFRRLTMESTPLAIPRRLRTATVQRAASPRAERMIKIKSYIVIAFSYRKAKKLRKWSEILHFCYGNKGLCHGCRSQWFR